MKCPKCGSTKTLTTNPGKRALAWGGGAIATYAVYS